ncbi:Concanavalin A-like lectin/glucanase [Beauveria bassiana ARSEF 2860]|uniref:Concanavalin A-like lectin/glucanase n=1 Tax=Beauveria bassiana (strain ARSEF 2860) TaxID=655819 RepID=J4VRL2_BEAB2|nr:Concanavalin A-like lectin/glucanase [Beauveria bassiana ARSEF 2860]EJP61245.1 Concanavalin A-like lectin/glucanase [Beauveria bassiana ARSEF 2860]
MPSLVSCLVAGLAVADRAASLSYTLSKTYDASNFLDEFDFHTADTNPWASNDYFAFTTYLNKADAVSKGLVSVQDGKIYLGVDYNTRTYGAGYRNSLRVQSKNSFKQGLVITRFSHLPKPVCGGWPFFGTLGTGRHPENSEIGMYEGWHLSPVNKVALYGGPESTGQCVLDQSAHTAGLVSSNCDHEFQYGYDRWKYQSCLPEETQNGIWGSSKGGIQALEWTSDAIRLYNWPIGAAPSNIGSSNPDTSSWGTPSAQFKGPGCDTQAFSNQTLQFRFLFCSSVNAASSAWSNLPADGKNGPTCKEITGAAQCIVYVGPNPQEFKDFYFGVEDIRIFDQDTQSQLSLDGSSPSFTFDYATSQSSSDNWIGIWPEDDTQAPQSGSVAWEYVTQSSGSIRVTPRSSMKAGKYKAYLLSNDRTILSSLPSFDYSPTSDSVAFSVKTHYNTNCAGSANNNVDIKPGNGVCVNTNCGVGSLEIPSVGSCPNGQVRISYWQHADCAGDWYGYGYGSRDTCRGLWSNGWGFRSLWLSCAEPDSDCIKQETCTAAPEPSTEVCRATADAGTTDAFHLKTRYSTGCTGDVHNEVTVPHGNGQCIDTNCAVGSLDIDNVGNCPNGELRISYWEQSGCSGKWFGYGYGSRNTCRKLWSGGSSFKSLWVSCAKQSDDCVSRGTCSIDEVPSRPVC